MTVFDETEEDCTLEITKTPPPLTRLPSQRATTDSLYPSKPQSGKEPRSRLATLLSRKKTTKTAKRKPLSLDWTSLRSKATQPDRHPSSAPAANVTSPIPKPLHAPKSLVQLRTADEPSGIATEAASMLLLRRQGQHLSPPNTANLENCLDYAARSPRGGPLQTNVVQSQPRSSTPVFHNPVESLPPQKLVRARRGSGSTPTLHTCDRWVPSDAGSSILDDFDSNDGFPYVRTDEANYPTPVSLARMRQGHPGPLSQDMADQSFPATFASSDGVPYHSRQLSDTNSCIAEPSSNEPSPIRATHAAVRGPLPPPPKLTPVREQEWSKFSMTTAAVGPLPRDLHDDKDQDPESSDTDDANLAQIVSVQRSSWAQASLRHLSQLEVPISPSTRLVPPPPWTPISMHADSRALQTQHDLPTVSGEPLQDMGSLRAAHAQIASMQRIIDGHSARSEALEDEVSRLTHVVNVLTGGTPLP